MNRRTGVLGAITFAMLFARPAAAQSPTLARDPGNTVWIQGQFVSFEGASAQIADAGAVMRMSPQMQIVVSVPFIHVSQELSSYDNKSSLLGNPYVGVRESHGNSSLDFGVRPPIVSDNPGEGPVFAGMMGDFDRWEIFLPHVFSLYLAGTMNYGAVDKDGIGARIRIGGSGLFPTKGGTSQFLADYGGVVTMRTGAVEVDGGLTGRMLINNAEGASLGERTVHHLVLGATYRGAARVHPTVFVRLPLDHDASAMYNSVIGVGAVMPLR